MCTHVLSDDRLSSVHGERRFEAMRTAQISDGQSGQTTTERTHKLAGVLRDCDDMTGYPCVALKPQMGAVYLP